MSILSVMEFDAMSQCMTGIELWKSLAVLQYMTGTGSHSWNMLEVQELLLTNKQCAWSMHKIQSDCLSVDESLCKL